MKQFLLKQKYRYDMGQTVSELIKFCLLVMASSDKIGGLLGITQTWLVLLVAIPAAFFVIWFFGWFLDSVVRYQQGYTDEMMQRSTMWIAHNKETEEIKADLKRILYDIRNS